MSEQAPRETGDRPEATDAAGSDAETPDPARFDEAMRELEGLVETLEQGDLSLEQSLGHYERGVGLARECRESLAAAEQKVRILQEGDSTDPSGDGTLTEFDAERDDQ